MYDTKIYAYEFIPSHKKRDPKVSFKEYSSYVSNIIVLITFIIIIFKGLDLNKKSIWMRIPKFFALLLTSFFSCYNVSNKITFSTPLIKYNCLLIGFHEFSQVLRYSIILWRVWVLSPTRPSAVLQLLQSSPLNLPDE